ncbi:hypothetical protein AYO44_11055 [Planctomycetaceae bacterium SCGC AG-212-F19]|nr:hypothetical protein AYO44_11055 [Planctomycetaceae bacterium SCGC AG-212-F19]
MARDRADNRSIYLVQPKFPPTIWGMDYLLRMTAYQAIFPPLGLLTLAALTPKEFHVTICDENAGERVDYDTSAQIVGITGYLMQKPTVLAHAEEFRKRGKTVVIGGPMANLLPEACRPYCDVLFENEAEYTWPRFLRDYAGGRWDDSYVETEKVHMPDSPPPRLELLRRRYAQGIVQCTRGCPFSCEFCDIIVVYGRKMRFKPVEHVLREVEAWHKTGVPIVFFADDNFVGNRPYAKELLKALARWNARQGNPLSFYTQASIDMVRDEELLRLMRDANFNEVFIGIESPRKSSLAETHKTQNEKLDLVDAVHTVQSHNMFVMAGMIVGFDNDDPEIFDEQFEFCQKAQIPIIMNSTLNATPRTPLANRLQAEGRLLLQDWTQDDFSHQIKPGITNFRPLRMTAEELVQGQQRLIRKLYQPEAFRDRLLGNLSRFRDSRFRSQWVTRDNLVSFFRLARFFGGQGKQARSFFWKALWSTLRRSPRNRVTVVTLLGKYSHILQLNGMARL